MAGRRGVGSPGVSLLLSVSPLPSAARWSSGIQMSPSPGRSWSEAWPGRTACFASSRSRWTESSWTPQVCALGRAGRAPGLWACQLLPPVPQASVRRPLSSEFGRVQLPRAHVLLLSPACESWRETLGRQVLCGGSRVWGSIPRPGPSPSPATALLSDLQQGPAPPDPSGTCRRL